MNVETAVIAAAGNANRLRPTSKAVDKCLMPVYAGDKLRILVDYTVEALAIAGITNLIFVHNKGADERLWDYYSLEHERYESLDMKFKFIEQPPGAYGTTVPLALAKEALKGITDFAYIASDDFVYHPNAQTSEFALAIAAWEAAGSDHLLMGNPVPREAAPSYGVLHVDQDGLLERFEEKPPLEQVPEDPLINISKYFFNESIWPFIDEEMATNRDGEHYITHPINAAKQTGHSFHVHRISGHYLDGGSVAGLRNTSNYIADHPQFNY